MNFTDCKKDEKINGVHINNININNIQKRKMIEEEKRKKFSNLSRRIKVELESKWG